MNDYILLMHSDATEAETDAQWESYFAKLREQGVFQGGSAIGRGEVLRKAGQPNPLSDHLVGFIRVKAQNLVHAKSLVEGNPVFENGGSVEVRELPTD